MSEHPLVGAVQPVVDAVGATLVPPDAARTERRRRCVWDGEVVGAVRMPPLHGALDRLIDAVEAELGGRLPDLGREDKQRAVRLLDERGARSRSGAPSSRSPTPWASAGSPSTTTSTRSTGERRFDVIGLDADDTLWHSEDSFHAVEARFVELVAPYAPDRHRRRRARCGPRSGPSCPSPGTGSRRSPCRWCRRRSPCPTARCPALVIGQLARRRDGHAHRDGAPAARRAGGARRPVGRPPAGADHQGRPRAPDAQGHDVGPGPPLRPRRGRAGEGRRHVPPHHRRGRRGAGALLHGRQLGAQRHPPRARARRPRRAHPVPAAVGARARRPRRGPRRAVVDRRPARSASRRPLPRLGRVEPPTTSRPPPSHGRAARCRCPGRSALPSSPPARPGPCADLVWHVGEVQHFWGSIVAERMHDPPAYVEPARPSRPRSCSPSPRTGVDRARRGARPPTRRHRCGRGRRSATSPFVVRRMAHEAAVHRVDAERAAGDDDGRSTPSSPPTASTSSSTSSFQRAVEGAPPLDGTVHLHCTDVDGEWLARHRRRRCAGGTARARQGRRRHPRPGARPADGAVAKRTPLDAVEVIGDRGVAERFVGRTDLG